LQLAALAYDLAETQLRDGTASAQVMTHFLKIQSSREGLEQDRLRMEVSLMEAKKEQLASQQRVEELYAQAIEAMQVYSGGPQLAIESSYDD